MGTQMMQIYGLKVLDDGCAVKSSSETYTFKTQEFAALFCKLLNQYEGSKCIGTISGTITYTVPNDFCVTPTFQFSLNGVTYTLDLSKPPNLFARVFLTLIGFKK